MDLENFENDIFWQISNINLNKIIQRNFKDFFEDFFKNLSENNHN
jgi:hypothetical protein